MNTEYIVEMKGISKSFGAVRALKNVDLELRYGEIMGIVGDNGAGKSTLMKVLSGAHQADEGELYIQGKKVHLHTPQDAFNLGIGMIFSVPAAKLTPAKRVLDRLGEEWFEIGRVIGLPRGASSRVIYV